jgi:hypothetical protein
MHVGNVNGCIPTTSELTVGQRLDRLMAKPVDHASLNLNGVTAVNHVLMTRAFDPMKRGEGWNADTCALMRFHLEAVQGSDFLSQETKGTTQRLCRLLAGASDMGRLVLGEEPREVEHLQRLEEEGEFLRPIVILDDRPHALLLHVQRQVDGKHTVRLFNTGLGIGHHASRDEKWLTYWGYCDVEAVEGDLFVRLARAESIDELYRFVSDLCVGGRPLPRPEAWERYMLDQNRGVCAYLMNVAVVRDTVLTQSNDVETNWMQYKLLKALLDWNVWQYDPAIQRLRRGEIDLTVARTRALKTSGDLIHARTAWDLDRYRSAAAELGVEGTHDTAPRRFRALRERSEAIAEGWFDSRVPSFSKQPNSFRPAQMCFRHRSAVDDHFMSRCSQAVRNLGVGPWLSELARIARAVEKGHDRESLEGVFAEACEQDWSKAMGYRVLKWERYLDAIEEYEKHLVPRMMMIHEWTNAEHPDTLSGFRARLRTLEAYAGQLTKALIINGETLDSLGERLPTGFEGFFKHHSFMLEDLQLDVADLLRSGSRSSRIDTLAKWVEQGPHTLHSLREEAIRKATVDYLCDEEVQPFHRSFTLWHLLLRAAASDQKSYWAWEEQFRETPETIRQTARGFLPRVARHPERQRRRMEGFLAQG